MTNPEQSKLDLAKNLIWNRRYKAWQVWFYALFAVTITCVFKDSLEILKVYAMWSTVGLVALVGGLSVTDLVKIKNGSG